MKMNPYNMPQIIKETSDGYFHLSVLDDLLSQREIYCLGEIDADSAGSLILQLQYLAAQDPEAEITLYINSPGGSVADGLALYDIMQTIPCPIRTVCMGTAASFGALLFTAGDTREIFPHSKIMIHDPLIAGQGLTGSATLLHTKIDSLMETRQILGELLARHTGKTLEEYFQFKRLSVAKTMLLKNGNTPALVARQLGYPNVQYFSLIFKKITGIAPSEYPYAQN